MGKFGTGIDIRIIVTSGICNTWSTINVACWQYFIITIRLSVLRIFRNDLEFDLNKAYSSKTALSTAVTDSDFLRIRFGMKIIFLKVTLVFNGSERDTCKTNFGYISIPCSYLKQN